MKSPKSPDEGRLALNFDKLDDFSPGRIAGNNPELQKLLALRQQLEAWTHAALKRGNGIDADALQQVAERLRHSEPPLPITDRVDFSVTGPGVVEPGSAFIVDVWAHLAEQREEVVRRAKEAQSRQDISIRSKLGVLVARGTSISVELAIQGCAIDDPTDVILWDGEVGNATFAVHAAADAQPGSRAGTAIFRIGGLRLARLCFTVTIGQKTAHVAGIAGAARPIRTAFASYASQDRDEVLGRIQGMQKVCPDLDVFLDVASLRSGQLWVDRLAAEITSRDVFYLFWSMPAKQSEWVEKEWRLALDRRGIDFIDPIPLAPPDQVPPPPELSGVLHFNDWVLAFQRNRKIETA